MRNISRQDCAILDRRDPLAGFRDEFDIPAGMIYFDGNSLGPPPRAALIRAKEVLEKEWGEGLVKSWNTANWFQLPRTLGDKVAKIIGADQGEVLLTDSTSINLHKVLSAAVSLRPRRRVILMESGNFPTNNYIAQGLAAQLNRRLEIRFTDSVSIADAIDESVAVVCLTHVHYISGSILDMAAITAKTRQAGALSVWDLCHSAGVVPVDVNACKVDFAVGCTYKYLNGGPGSPAFLFVARRHNGRARQPLTGWWGHADPFAFERDYRPAHDVRQMLSGTQPILSMAVAEAGLDICLRADTTSVREKSRKLTGLFIDLIGERCSGFGFTLASPLDSARRGSHVSLEHDQAYGIVQALISRQVVGDFRAPSNIRLGFAPLFISYTDVWDAVERLLEVMKDGQWRRPNHAPPNTVT